MIYREKIYWLSKIKTSRQEPDKSSANNVIQHMNWRRLHAGQKDKAQFVGRNEVIYIKKYVSAINVAVGQHHTSRTTFPDIHIVSILLPFKRAQSTSTGLGPQCYMSSLLTQNYLLLIILVFSPAIAISIFVLNVVCGLNVFI